MRVLIALCWIVIAGATILDGLRDLASPSPVSRGTSILLAFAVIVFGAAIGLLFRHRWPVSILLLSSVFLFSATVWSAVIVVRVEAPLRASSAVPLLTLTVLAIVSLVSFFGVLRLRGDNRK